MTDPLRDRLRAGLTDAMRARDRSAVAVLRVALAAIDNAEAVPAGTTAPGETEVARRELADAEITAVVVAEIEQLLAGAAEYDDVGQGHAATELRQQAATLDAFLIEPPA